MMLATIPPPPGQQIDIGPLSIHFYGILIGIGALLAIGIGRRRYAALGGDPDLIDRIGVVAVLAGLVGARLGYVITHLSNYSGRPWAVLFVWEGGLAIFPGLALGFAVGVWYARRLGMPVMPTLDAMVPGIPLAQAFGRWGNYFNQELYGTPTTVPWALEVEPIYRVPPYEAFSTFHPTFLYESLLNLILFVTLLRLGRQQKLRQGSIVWLYLIGYGFIRFCVELLRTDTTFRLFGLSRNNWAALVAFLAGLYLLRWWQRRAPDRPMGAPIIQPVGESTEGSASDDETGASETADDTATADGEATTADADAADDSDAAVEADAADPVTADDGKADVDAADPDAPDDSSDDSADEHEPSSTSTRS